MNGTSAKGSLQTFALSKFNDSGCRLCGQATILSFEKCLVCDGGAIGKKFQ
jgi:hypothetical protein